MDKHVLMFVIHTTALCFLLVFATHLFHQEAFLSVNAAEVACFPCRLAGEMVTKKCYDPGYGYRNRRHLRLRILLEVA